ncbi:MAG: helix-turn-helix domain-containing protein [Pseudomonadota bacterium]
METNDKRLISTDEAAALLGLSPRTLEALRFRREGPPYVKLGRAVRYDLGELEDWIASNRVEPTEASDG